MKSKSLQLLTYNIHKVLSTGKIKRQEKRIQNWPDASQFEFLSDQLWPHYAYAKNAIYQSGHHGNAILSKYPIISWENINVATISRASRSLLHGIIEIPESNQRLHVICIHLGLFKAERTEQMQVLTKRIAEHVPEHEPLIIAGDFNDWRAGTVDVLEQDLGLKEVFKELEGKYAKTFPAIHATLRVDRVYYRGVELVSGKCLDEKPWRLLSDHLPLYAKFNIK